jgi:hypothetical protein
MDACVHRRSPLRTEWRPIEQQVRDPDATSVNGLRNDIPIQQRAPLFLLARRACASNSLASSCYRASMVMPALAFALCVASIAQNLDSNSAQFSGLHFSAEDEGVKNAVPIPEDVWSLLKQDDDVREVLKRQSPTVKTLPREWFSAAFVHLHQANENDLVVQAEGPMMGANMTEFWVFRRDVTRSQLVLKIPAHDLLIRETESGGYKIIEASAITAATHVSTLTYKFDGNHYALSR